MEYVVLWTRVDRHLGQEVQHFQWGVQLFPGIQFLIPDETYRSSQGEASFKHPKHLLSEL